jgi:hypothetical protein
VFPPRWYEHTLPPFLSLWATSLVTSRASKNQQDKDFGGGSCCVRTSFACMGAEAMTRVRAVTCLDEEVSA